MLTDSIIGSLTIKPCDLGSGKNPFNAFSLQKMQIGLQRWPDQVLFNARKPVGGVRRLITAGVRGSRSRQSLSILSGRRT